MKIAIVCPYDLGAGGGVQDQAIAMVRWLAAEGHDARLVGPGTKIPAGAIGVGPVTAVTANGSTTPISMRAAAWRRTAAAIDGVDVVHIHEPLMPVVSQAAVLSARSVAKVGTFHADPSRLVRSVYRRAGLLVRRLTNQLDVATAVSPIAAGAVAGLTEARVIPNAIEVASFSTGPKKPLQVAFLGRDDPRKGLDVLIAAWSVVRARLPEAELLVAGTVRDPLPGVRFLGYVDDGQKRRLLAESAVFCAPNLGGESFGIVIAEAMASGCAVVASGLPAFVHVAGSAGRFVRPGDVVGLAGALVDVLTSVDGAAAMASSGSLRVADFDRSVVVEKYLDAYRAAIAVHASRRESRRRPVH